MKVRWIRPYDSKMRHAHVTGNTTLCNLFLDKYDTKPEGLRCGVCVGFEKRLLTPEGALIYTALGTVDVVDPKAVWALASYVVEQSSLLARELADATARIDTLYKPPSAGSPNST